VTLAIGVPSASLTAALSPSPAPSTTAVYVMLGSSVLLGFSVAVAVLVPAV
jgi:hypothetical protein